MGPSYISKAPATSTIKSLNLATANSLVIRTLFTSKNDNIVGIKSITCGSMTKNN
ncbi:hypothetical protein R6Q57_006271 [Mikania cordata]